MKYKPKNLKPVVLIVVVALVLIAAASYLGIVTTRSAIRIGYIGNGGCAVGRQGILCWTVL